MTQDKVTPWGPATILWRALTMAHIAAIASLNPPTASLDTRGTRVCRKGRDSASVASVRRRPHASSLGDFIIIPTHSVHSRGY